VDTKDDAVCFGIEDFPEGALEREPTEEEENESMTIRQKNFRAAAEAVARALAEIPTVEKVALFGSVAVPLRKEISRLQPFRRLGIELLHECKDVDIAVWVNDMASLRLLQKARCRALSGLLHEKNIGVAHHQVDIFIMEPGAGRFLGNLCAFGVCPKGKPDCLAEGCGRVQFLKKYDGFQFNADALTPGKSIILFDRNPEMSNVKP